MSVNRNLEDKLYFREEIDINDELRYWFYKDFFYASIEVNEKCFILEINKKGILINNIPFKGKKENDVITFLICLLCSYPNTLGVSFIEDFLKNDIVNTYKILTKRKNEFVNKLDRQLQIALGYNPPERCIFRVNNRKFINFKKKYFSGHI